MWLGQAPDVHVIGEAYSGGEAVKLAQALTPDVVLIDLSLSPQKGISTTIALRALASQSAIVLLSLHDGEDIRAQALAAGAGAFVGAQEGVLALLPAIRQVMKTWKSSEEKDRDDLL
jgi:DNA-binding NarL/FixJ family response regulator